MPDNPDDGDRAGEVGALVLAMLVAVAAGVYRPPRPTGSSGVSMALGARAAVTGPHDRRATTLSASLELPGTATPSPSPTPTATIAVLADGAVDPPPPYFRFRRPFDPPLQVEPSRFYPYGTTGGGAYLLHHGVDIGNPMGTPVLAVGDGTVVYAGTDLDQAWGPMTDFYGNLVVLRHPESIDGDPLYSLYGHLSEVKVGPGQAVSAGDVIGLIGMAGIALGPHLHLEFRTRGQDYGATRNPELLFQPLPGHGTVVGRVVDRSDQPVPSADVALYAAGPEGRGRWLVGMTTYPSDHVNSTRAWQENFLFADTPAGRYDVVAKLGRLSASSPITITEGSTVRVTLTLDRGAPVPPTPAPPAPAP